MGLKSRKKELKQFINFKELELMTMVTFFKNKLDGADIDEQLVTTSPEKSALLLKL